jgi:hypothetical protein
MVASPRSIHSRQRTRAAGGPAPCRTGGRLIYGHLIGLSPIARAPTTLGYSLQIRNACGRQLSHSAAVDKTVEQACVHVACGAPTEDYLPATDDEVRVLLKHFGFATADSRP